jgi:hypothetical protein
VVFVAARRLYFDARVGARIKFTIAKRYKTKRRHAVTQGNSRLESQTPNA